MTNLEGEQHSFWRTTSPKISYPKLENDIEVDVAVIGGGISGVLAAYCLTNAGKQVALIEAREFGGGSTGGTTAKLSSQHHLIYNDMIERDGEQTAKKFYEANENGRQLIESIVKQHNIDCDFSTVDSFVYAKEGSNTDSLQQEAKAYETLGIDGELVESVPLNLSVDSALVMRNQAEFHPMKFLHGVLQELDNMGAKLFQHTRYMDKEVHDDHLTLQTDSGRTVTCQQVVYATLFPVEDPQSFFSDTLQPMSSHLTAFGAKKPMADGMYISTEEPIRTFRKSQTNNKEVVIVGGDTHPTGDETPTTERYEAIQQFAAETFETTDMLAYWSEHDQMTPDRRPFIGPLEEGEDRMFVMTGYNKWGLAISGSAAQLITDLICKKDNEFKQLLSPQRDLPSDDEDEEESSDDEKEEQNDENEPLVSHIADQLKEGEAKSFMQNGEPTGMYKDKNGDIHCMNLSCTHLGCEVSWNNGDETWDCPCHGSVFDGTGKVIAGPAKEPLKQVNPF